jgi:hypothetical protein
MRILLPLLITAALLSSGVINTYYAIRYRVPPVTTLKETPASSLPTYVTLKNLSFDADNVLKPEIGFALIYIPVRDRNAPGTEEYSVVIQTSDRKLIEAANAKSPDALAQLGAIAQRTEVTGRVSRRSPSDRDVERLRKALPSISPDMVLIDEGAKPSPIFGGVMLFLGLGVGGIAIAGGFKPATPKNPTPTSS